MRAKWIAVPQWTLALHLAIDFLAIAAVGYVVNVTIPRYRDLGNKEGQLAYLQKCERAAKEIPDDFEQFLRLGFCLAILEDRSPPALAHPVPRVADPEEGRTS